MIQYNNICMLYNTLSPLTEAIPLGFVQIPVTVNSFAWDDISGRVLLSLGDGGLVPLS